MFKTFTSDQWIFDQSNSGNWFMQINICIDVSTYMSQITPNYRFSQRVREIKLPSLNALGFFDANFTPRSKCNQKSLIFTLERIDFFHYSPRVFQNAAVRTYAPNIFFSIQKIWCTVNFQLWSPNHQKHSSIEFPFQNRYIFQGVGTFCKEQILNKTLNQINVLVRIVSTLCYSKMLTTLCQNQKK